MRKFVPALVISSLILSGCGWSDSRVNPKNWFGRSKPVAAAPADGSTNPLIPAKRRGLLARPEKEDVSVPIDTITALRIEPTNSGAIIYASGVASRQGAFEARLRPDNPDLIPEDGVLNFTFRVVYPRNPTPVGSELSRTVHEAYSISAQTLSAVRTIRVSGARNAQESRRR
ncbi:hypothetical protein ACXYMO_00825 [Arenibacterium sp. CAU 1754]